MADFVGRVVKDPKSPPETLLLQGFVGQSSEDGHTRLYLDPTLSSFVDIPDDAILYSKDTPEAGPLGGTYVWIKRDAQVIRGAAGPQRYKGTFLEGPIFGPGGLPPGGWPGGGGVPPITLPPQCPIINTRPPFCYPFTPHCPPTPLNGPCLPHTPLNGCPPLTPHCPPTPLHHCVTLLHHCPTPVQPCLPHTLPLHGCPNTSPPLCIMPTQPIACPKTTPAVCPVTLPPACHVTSPPLCVQTAPVNCPSHVIACNTFVCPVTNSPACVLQTAQVVCHQTLAGCPSAVDACPSAPGGCGFPGGLPGFVNQ